MTRWQNIGKMVLSCLNSNGDENSKKIWGKVGEHLGKFQVEHGGNIYSGWVVKSVCVFPTCQWPAKTAQNIPA